MEIHEVLREKIDLILEKPEVKRVIERLGIGEIKSGLEESQDGFWFRFSNTTEGESRSGSIRIGIDNRGYFISFDIETLKGRRKDDDYIRFVYDWESNIEVIRNVATNLSSDSVETIRWAHRYERDPKHIHLVTESELWGDDVKNIKKRVIDLTRKEGDIATLTGAIGGKEHDPKEDDKEVKKRLQEKLKSTRDPEGCRVYCDGNRNIGR